MVSGEVTLVSTKVDYELLQTFSYVSLHSPIENTIIDACSCFSEMNLNRGTAKDNFQKKLDALTEEGMATLNRL